MPGPIVSVGAPIALRGQLPGMKRTPGELRRRGLVSPADPPALSRIFEPVR